jgi:prepilin-type N-terminal cleavage/methylation domain-containing protein/prepilin-type processing-associated H-X9-DG protein
MARKQQQGFTLIELLVTVSIIAVLIALLLPSLSKARATAKTTACAANIRTVYTGLSMYAGDNSGLIPPATYREPNPRTGTFKTWIEPLLPILRSTTNRSGTPMVFICPSQLKDPKERSSYGLNGRLGDDRITTPSTFGFVNPDGTIDTTNGWFRLSAAFRPMDLYLLSDVGTNGSGSQNYVMQDPTFDGSSLRHPGPKGLNVAFADGHIELKPRLTSQSYGKLPWWNRP